MFYRLCVSRRGALSGLAAENTRKAGLAETLVGKAQVRPMTGASGGAQWQFDLPQRHTAPTMEPGRLSLRSAIERSSSARRACRTERESGMGPPV